jgi:nucleoside-diphosphate-sugar epimerase
VGDVVRAHNKCIENDDVNGEVFNIGSGIGISIKDLSQKVAELFLGSKDRVIFEDISEGAESKILQGKKRNAAELKCMLLDITKAKEKLNWEPKISLEDGLQREYNWAKKNKHRWQNIVYTNREK